MFLFLVYCSQQSTEWTIIFSVVATVPTLVYQLGLIWPIFGPCGVGVVRSS